MLRAELAAAVTKWQLCAFVYVPFDTNSLALSATILEGCAEPKAFELICVEGITDSLVSLLHCNLRFLEAYTGLLLFLALPYAGQFVTTNTLMDQLCSPEDILM